MNPPIEASYPITFRQNDATILGTLLRQFHSVNMVGLKRVGISNFLRFFLYHPQISATYIKNGHHLFIPVDLNDLIDIGIEPFWKLTLKRLTDTLDNSHLSESLKTLAQKKFLEAIQLNEPIVTLDNIKKILSQILNQNIYPTIFLIRFDRLQHHITPEFFANLQGIVESGNQKTTFVFTSFCPLHQLNPQVFTKSSLAVFAKELYLKPAKDSDLSTILNTFTKRYSLNLDSTTTSKLLKLSAGHVQYLQLALIHLKNNPSTLKSPQLLSLLSQDEEIYLQSEELFHSLNPQEQTLISQLNSSTKQFENLSQTDYLSNTGLIHNNHIFSPLLAHYLKHHTQKTSSPTDFTKKEHLLYTILHQHLDQLVERDQIIEAVWPDQAELGVSDWAIDRLIARTRKKLSRQKSVYKIVTIISRGYKLTYK